MSDEYNILFRVVHVGTDGTCYIVIPGWSNSELVRLKMKRLVPEGVELKIDDRFMCRGNLSADSAHMLHLNTFQKIEPPHDEDNV